MTTTKKPGESTGNKGGIYQEVGPRGGKQPNYATVPDNRPPAASSHNQAWPHVGPGEGDAE